MNYTLYHAEDFAADEFFISFYLRIDQAAIIFWEDWISRHPEKIDEIFNAEQILAMMHFRLPEEEFHEETKRFEDFLGVQATKKTSPKKIFQFKHTILLMSIMASLIAVLSLIFYLYPAPLPVDYVTTHNGYGKILTLKLADGTAVTLNANSTLKFPKFFSGKTREVFLTGEAFFNVVKNKSKPFIVAANGTKTTVLGTQFNVSAYPSNPNIKVALIAGSVEFSANAGHDKMLLQPAEMATFSTKSKSLIRSPFNPYLVTSWKNGIISFQNASFKDIADKIKNVYGIVLLNQSGKKNWNYSGQFEKTDYISIVKSICFAENITFQTTNQTITLKPKQ